MAGQFILKTRMKITKKDGSDLEVTDKNVAPLAGIANKWYSDLTLKINNSIVSSSNGLSIFITDFLYQNEFSQEAKKHISTSIVRYVVLFILIVLYYYYQ